MNTTDAHGVGADAAHPISETVPQAHSSGGKTNDNHDTSLEVNINLTPNGFVAADETNENSQSVSVQTKEISVTGGG